MILNFGVRGCCYGWGYFYLVGLRGFLDWDVLLFVCFC